MILTPKEKANELVEKFYKFVDKTRVNKCDNQPELDAKECAKIVVEQIINSTPLEPTYKYNDGKVKYELNSQDYWEQVKHEIDNYDKV